MNLMEMLFPSAQAAEAPPPGAPMVLPGAVNQGGAPAVGGPAPLGGGLTDGPVDHPAPPARPAGVGGETVEQGAPRGRSGRAASATASPRA
jgi:hypothetical protein